MKILTVLILFLAMLTTGCSQSGGHKHYPRRELPTEDARRLDRHLPERLDRHETNEASTSRH
ncbi:MAG: hypothetical protein ACYTDV_10225 [Planctomycetota bacterium]|jgi:hypothetical protein